MLRQLTINSALALDVKALNRLGNQCQSAATALGANSAEAKPFADMEAAIWAILDLIEEAKAARPAL